jgi:hypothetical protein
MSPAVGKSNGLGFGHGSLIEYDDGTVEYRQYGKFLPAFKVRVADVIGFSVRRATREDKKRLEATFLQQVLNAGVLTPEEFQAQKARLLG